MTASEPAHYNRFLHPELQHDRIEVVLISPRNPLNIGAAARAMVNFGFSHLSVVAAYAPHWREAKSAVGAPEILQNATETAALSEAVAACTLVIGTGTLTHRKPEQPVVSLPKLAPLVRRGLDRGGRVAMVFGPEKHGLTREDLSYCHLLVEIPTAPRQPSMNLGQAVAVCLYELSTRLTTPDMSSKNPARATAVPEPGSPLLPDDDLSPTATAGNLELLAGVVEQVMDAADYSPAVMRKANQHDLRLLLRRLALTKRDMRRVLGLLRRILWRLGHNADSQSGRKAE
jgi:TrmH family RNA methyltransferase